MKAVWAIGRLTTELERAQAVDFAADLGFDTIVTGSATMAMVDRAHSRSMQVITVVHAYPENAFARSHPHCLQKMRAVEQDVSAVLAGQPWDLLHGDSFRWYSSVLPKTLLCFAHPEAESELKNRVEQALKIADGIALDGFGYANYYACFCQRCEELRGERYKESAQLTEMEIMAQVSAQILVDVHRRLYDHAKACHPDALAINHVWPPFLPDETIGRHYKLDFCTQTISWFYPPEWPLERVAFEAATLKRLENPDLNRCVPFIGIQDRPYARRQPGRLAKEIAIALEHGAGHLVLSRLTTLQTHPELARVVKSAFTA